MRSASDAGGFTNSFPTLRRLVSYCLRMTLSAVLPATARPDASAPLSTTSYGPGFASRSAATSPCHSFVPAVQKRTGRPNARPESVVSGNVDLTVSLMTLPGWMVRDELDTVNGLPSCPATEMLSAHAIRANVKTPWRTMCEVLRTILTAVGMRRDSARGQSPSPRGRGLLNVWRLCAI